METRSEEKANPNAAGTRLIVAAATTATTVLSAIYTWGYFAATTGVGYARPSGERLRVFGARWQAKFFTPGTRVESLIVGQDIHAEW